MFVEMRREFPSHQFIWIDVEDNADAVGDCDIETFPTILIADQLNAKFFGPVLPGADSIRRLLLALSEDAAALMKEDGETKQLVQRLAFLTTTSHDTRPTDVLHIR